MAVLTSSKHVQKTKLSFWRRDGPQTQWWWSRPKQFVWLVPDARPTAVHLLWLSVLFFFFSSSSLPAWAFILFHHSAVQLLWLSVLFFFFFLPGMSLLFVSSLCFNLISSVVIHCVRELLLLYNKSEPMVDGRTLGLPLLKRRFYQTLPLHETGIRARSGNVWKLDDRESLNNW